jgi:hypothetical protein
MAMTTITNTIMTMITITSIITTTTIITTTQG